MRKLLFVLAAGGVLASGQATAHDYVVPGLKIGNPWSRPAAAGSVGAGFGTITNTGQGSVTLVSIQTPAARSASVHQTMQMSGVYSMKSADSLVINPGQTVTFAPGGYHVMFSGLKAPLAVGGKVPATLTFRRGGKTTPVQVAFDVSTSAPAATTGHNHQH